MSASRLEPLEGRETAHRLLPVTIEVDGELLDAYEGESLAAAMLVGGREVFRLTRSGAPRGPLCNMGVCFECVVEVEGLGEVRACMTAVSPNLAVRTSARSDDPPRRGDGPH